MPHSPPRKNVRLESLADTLITALANKNYTKDDLKLLKSRMEDLVVEWGVSAALLPKLTDHALMARLLAYAVVLGE